MTSGKSLSHELRLPLTRLALRKVLAAFIVLAALISGPALGAAEADRMDKTAMLLSNAAYCSSDDYLSLKFEGESAGFVPTHLLSDNYTDTRGFVGHLSEQKTIFVVFRGSTSAANWWSDLDSLLIYYHYDKCALCFVHRGFNIAQQSVQSQVLSAIEELRSRFPSYRVVVTGHSLGGALATLTAAAIARTDNVQPSDIRLVTFGQPRVGNEYFSSYLANKLPAIFRYTHLRDPVPHLPPRDHSYMHAGEERYEDENGRVKACVGPEDAQCADQWTYRQDVQDHMQYLGIKIGCTAATS